MNNREGKYKNSPDKNILEGISVEEDLVFTRQKFDMTLSFFSSLTEIAIIYSQSHFSRIT